MLGVELNMQFEDFSATAAPPLQSPAATAESPAANNIGASPNERFAALCRAVSSAVKGNFAEPLPLNGHDRLTVLSKQLEVLFESARNTLPSAATAGLVRENERLKYLIANTPAIIYSSVPTGDGAMTFVSDNARRLLNYDPGEMVADPSFWFDRIHPDDVPTIFSSFALIFTQGHQTYEYRFRAKDGKYVWMHDSLRLIRDADGNPVEVVGSLTNITDRKLMEEALQRKGEEQQLLINQLRETQAQLLQSEKMASIGQLAAGVAHEINNPIGFVNSNMNSLRGYVDTLCELIEGFDRIVEALSDHPDLQAAANQLKLVADFDFLREDVTQLVKESTEGLKRVKDIVQSLKDFAHIGETDWQYADLHVGIDSTLTIAANEFKYKAVVQKYYGALPLVKCLASQLNQVFMNLIVNASQAINESGVITIRTGASEGWVWIEIGDNGCGIPLDTLKRIFEPFFTTKPIGKGTGLGLSMSYNIVNKHGGRIEVASEVGHGTRFTVHLPVNPPNATGQSSA